MIGTSIATSVTGLRDNVNHRAIASTTESSLRPKLCVTMRRSEAIIVRLDLHGWRQISRLRFAPCLAPDAKHQHHSQSAWAARMEADIGAIILPDADVTVPLSGCVQYCPPRPGLSPRFPQKRSQQWHRFPL